MSSLCFHCGEKIPHGLELTVNVFNKAQSMCCIGCQAVAKSIVDNGLVDYYKYRTEPAFKGVPVVPEQLKRHQLLDDDALQNEFTHVTDQYKEAILTVDGISCAACAWLIEKKTSQLQGVSEINVNATSQRATVRWIPEQIKLSEILATIDEIGYHALPFKASSSEEINQANTKQFIRRLGISGILMMQVMMIAIGLYFGAFSDMSEHIEQYLRYTSLFLSIPIIFYGAFPFYIGAINALRSHRLSMDVPVSIAIILAFSASVWATVMQTGEVYFESISMFTFLLLIGKFLEFRARSRAAQVSANLLKLMPMTATKLENYLGLNNEQKREIFIAAKKLICGDIVLIKPGEVVPADGSIIEGISQLNEAMLSGEQLPIEKKKGDQIFAGTINGDGNLIAEVKYAGTTSFLSQLIRLSEASQAYKPKVAQLSDKIAQYFVAVILFTAIGTAIYWQQHLPDEAFWITLSVLVATCPCALSLATPTALTCATTRLNKEGIMIKGGHVMETIPHINCIAFDKTGTLTQGDFSITSVELISSNVEYTKEYVLALSAALEVQSEHPLAKAFSAYRDFSINIIDSKVINGCGVQATLINENKKVSAVKIGKPRWLLNTNLLNKYQHFQCVLLINDELVAAFTLSDVIREDASNVVSYLKNNHIHTVMLSGDNQMGCEKVASALSINEIYSGLTAQNKVDKINVLQEKYTVAMIGDGVNDSPVFSAAHIAIAMGGGTEVAKSGADVILLNNQLSSLKTLKNVAKFTKQIIWQNYAWAFGYNAIVLPLAVCGFITPYMAVIGMSASSILVITNSLRLLRK